MLTRKTVVCIRTLLRYSLNENSGQIFFASVLESMMTTSDTNLAGTNHELASNLNLAEAEFKHQSGDDGAEHTNNFVDHHQDECGDLLAHSEEHVDPSKTESASAAKSVPRNSKHEQGSRDARSHKPSHVLFLPNMSRDASERDLSSFASKLPFQPKKTFLYMSESAHHGFIECNTIDHASRNLEFINADNLEVRGRRVLAEFSRRKNVEDRRTYERRQHARKRPDDREDNAPRREERAPRRRSRSRTPPRPLYRRSPPRDYGRDRLPPREYRDEYLRREPPIRGPREIREPPRERDSYRYPPSRYDGPPPSYRRDYEDDYPRQSYREPVQQGYQSGSHYPPSSNRGYPPYAQPESHYAPPPVRSPSPEGYASYSYQQPPSRDPYAPSYGTAAGGGHISHPLLSLQTPVRPTTVGTHPPPGYQQYQYK